MQDLKHLTQKKTSAGSGRFSSGSRNRRLNSADEPVRTRLLLPRGKRRSQLKMTLLFIAVVLVIVPFSTLILQQSKSAALHFRTWLTSFSGSAPEIAEAAKTPVLMSRFTAASELLASAESNGSRLSARTPDGEQHIYTIKGDLQRRVYDLSLIHI